MKSVVLLIVLATAGFGQAKADLIPADEKFTKDAKVEYTTDYITPERRKLVGLPAFEPLRVEIGTINEVSYRFYYSDGSGSFEGSKGNGIDYKRDVGENWSVSCEKDPIDDSKYCVATKNGLYIFNFSKSGLYVSVGSNNYPGSEVAIRVGTNPAFFSNEKAQFNGAKGSEVLKAFTDGKQVTIRYQEWPKGYDTVRTFDLYGFNEASRYIKWAVSKIK